MGGRVEVGVWIVDGTGCTAALRFAALHLRRNGRCECFGGERAGEGGGLCKS